MSLNANQVARSGGWQKRSFVRAVLVAGGALYVSTGLLMLLLPEWFYQNIGTFPPFNRHYTGDLGSFNLPLGLALLWAVRNPARHCLLIGCAALASLIHALNHTYDDIQMGLSLSEWLVSQTFILLVFALTMVLAWWWAQASE